MVGLDQSVDGVIRSAVTRLEVVGIESAQHDARLLFQHASGLSHAGLISSGRDPVDEDVLERFEALLARRLAREPVFRIVGQRTFYGLDLALSVETLEPRADTETLVDAVLDWLQGRRNEALRFADLGTGTGAIGLALLNRLPGAYCLATDISADALETARNNARTLDLSARFSTLKGSWFGALEPDTAPFDFIVSNPPYIATPVIETLDPEVRLHDPFEALDGGADGLDAYRATLSGAAAWLKPGGLLFLEIGFDQAGELAELANTFDARVVDTVADLAGNDRVVTVKFT